MRNVPSPKDPSSEKKVKSSVGGGSLEKESSSSWGKEAGEIEMEVRFKRKDPSSFWRWKGGSRYAEAVLRGDSGALMNEGHRKRDLVRRQARSRDLSEGKKSAGGSGSRRRWRKGVFGDRAGIRGGGWRKKAAG